MSPREVRSTQEEYITKLCTLILFLSSAARQFLVSLVILVIIKTHEKLIIY